MAKGTPHTQGINKRVSAAKRFTGGRVSQDAVGYAGGKLLPSTRAIESGTKTTIEDRCSHQIGKVVRRGDEKY